MSLASNGNVVMYISRKVFLMNSSNFSLGKVAKAYYKLFDQLFDKLDISIIVFAFTSLTFEKND